MLFWIFLFFHVSSKYFGVSIIPKWLIKIPGPIPILFGWFLELPTCTQHLNMFTPFLCRNASTNTKKMMETFFKIFFIYELQKQCRFGERRAPKNDEDPSTSFLNMGPISTWKHEWIFINMVPISISKHEHYWTSKMWATMGEIGKNKLGDLLRFLMLFIGEMCSNNTFKNSGELCGSILV